MNRKERKGEIEKDERRSVKGEKETQGKAINNTAPTTYITQRQLK